MHLHHGQLGIYTMHNIPFLEPIVASSSSYRDHKFGKYFFPFSNRIETWMANSVLKAVLLGMQLSDHSQVVYLKSVRKC